MLNILPVIRKEFRQLYRDKRTFTILLFIPAFLLFMFGYVINFDVRHTKVVFYDEDRSSLSRKLIEEITTSEYFDYVEHINHPASIDKILDSEKARVIVVIPYDFSKNITMGKEAKVQILIDGSNATAGNIVAGYINAIFQQYSLRIIVETIQKSGQKTFTLPILYKPRVWYNPELRSAKFTIPGLIAFIVTITTVISTVLSVVKEREIGTIEQIKVSPLSSVELIIGKTVPYMIVSIIATTLVLILGYLLFGVEIKGNIFFLSIVVLIFICVGLGLGLLISTLAETQQFAFTVSALITILPTFILSGFVFPIRNMPYIIQLLTYIVPARYFIAVLRAIILKGVGWNVCWKEIVILLTFAFLLINISIIRMRRILK